MNLTGQAVMLLPPRRPGLGDASCSIELCENATEWHLVLTRLPEPILSIGRRRLLLAGELLLTLDAAARLKLERRGRYALTIPKVSKPVFGNIADLIRPLIMPIRVHDSLYAYQRHGVAWLLTHDRALLGDDMGLGKTAQALSGVRRLVRWGRVRWCLVIAPSTLLPTWTTEVAKWAPELVVSQVRPQSADREKDWSRAARRSHLVVTNYEQLRDLPSALVKHPPDLIIADEAHRLRKSSSQAFGAVRKLRTQRFWALTGTPVEKDADDLAALLTILDPKAFSIVDSQLPAASLRSRARPYMLRRNKRDVLNELPPSVEIRETLELNSEQKAAYLRAIREHSASGELSALPLFTRLRAICDLDTASGSSVKLDRIQEILDEIRAAGEKAVIFSYQLAPLHALAERLISQGIRHRMLTGEMDHDDRATSIRQFQQDSECTALLASTRVGSEGLTLTEANHVVFINRWWNPSANDQAADRVHRIGQTRTVYVRSYVCQRTFEARLDELLSEKRATFDELVESISVGDLSLT